MAADRAESHEPARYDQPDDRPYGDVLDHKEHQ
jgi:hypothetical protein